MRRISEHVYAEISFWGCNPGVFTAPDGARDVDPYPIGQRLFAMSDNLTERNIRNMYGHVVARQTVAPGV